MTQYSEQSRYYHHLFYGNKVVVCNNDEQIVKMPATSKLAKTKLFDNLKKNVGKT